MMSKELFVTNFISGKAEGSQKMRWWLQHGAATSLFVQKWRSKKKNDGILERDQIRAVVQKSCSEWNALVYHSHKYPFMAEHAALEMALVDAAMGSDTERGKGQLLSISEFLMENVEKQIRHHRFDNSEFPIGTWKDLLLGHVKLFTESIRWYITSDPHRYAECEERRMRNTLALAAFSTEWL